MTTTLPVRSDLDEVELARDLETEFDAGWFPAYRRWSISTGDGAIYIDYEPGVALYVSVNAPGPETVEVAARVALWLKRVAGPSALPATPEPAAAPQPVH